MLLAQPIFGCACPLRDMVQVVFIFPRSRRPIRKPCRPAGAVYDKICNGHLHKREGRNSEFLLELPGQGLRGRFLGLDMPA
jgi:hypothetical protein